LCEWFAFPLVSIAGSNSWEPEFTELMHPISERLLARCDSVLRVGGLAAGADLVVALARQRGIRVYQDLDDAPAGYNRIEWRRWRDSRREASRARPSRRSDGAAARVSRSRAVRRWVCINRCIPRRSDCGRRKRRKEGGVALNPELVGVRQGRPRARRRAR